MTLEIRTAGSRFVTRAEGRETFHSFAFGPHYDPANLGFAAMTALNDEHLPPGTGYANHPHRDVEIITWVLDGALRHTDSTGHSVVLGPGELLRTSAGSGIVHAEVADSPEPTRFLQTWLRPDEPGLPPSLAGTRPGVGDGLVEVIGPGASVEVGTRGARLFLARPRGATTLALPDAPRLHVFVVDGAAELGDRCLGPGDAARLDDEGGRSLVIPASATISVWSFRS